MADDALNQDFTGQLASYKKDDLKALAIALGLSDNNGTNTQLLSRIEDHFKAHPELKKNSRFSGLFNRASQSGRHAAPNLNRAALNILTSHD